MPEEHVTQRIAMVAHVCMREYVEAVNGAGGFDDTSIVGRPAWRSLEARQRERYEAITVKFLLHDDRDVMHFTRLLMAAEDPSRIFEPPSPQTKAAFAIYLNMTLKIHEMLLDGKVSEEDL